jgi:hypothetical protein
MSETLHDGISWHRLRRGGSAAVVALALAWLVERAFDLKLMS